MADPRPSFSDVAVDSCLLRLGSRIVVEGMKGASAMVDIRHGPKGYFAQRVPSLVLASSFRNCLNCGVLTCMFAWRTRYPLSLS